ncbi:MAG: hypothetical protein RIS73_1663, partial [Bacteroidota bacterium]
LSSIWDFGDGTTGTGDTVTHTYALPGNYIVKLNVALAGGCNGSAVKLVFIAQPTGSFSFSGGSYCNSQTVRFDAITSYADSLFWDFGDGSLLQTTQTTVTHTYNTAGIFIPSLTIKSLGGCQTIIPATDSIKIDIINAGFTNNEVKICGGTTVHFTDTSYSYFGIASRTWDFGDGNTGSGTNISHTYATTGTYNVRLTINSIGGCSDNEIKPIYVKVNDIPIVSIIGDTVTCQSSSVTFNSSIQSVDSVNYYHWTSSNGLSGSSNSFTLAFNQPGNYTIQLITRTVNGCADTTTHLIKINPTPDISQPAGQILCNADFTLPINFSSSVAGTIFNWTNTSTLIGLAASGTGDISSFQAYSNGAYVANAAIRVTPVANGCSGPQKQFGITVYPTPNVVKPADQALCNNSNTTAIAFTGTVATTTYNWVNNNPSIGLAASGTGDIPSFTATSNGANIAVASITVTPFVNSCPGVPKVFVITVYPTPDVAQPTDQILCNNSNTTAIAFSGAVTGTTYNWTNNNPSIGLAASGTGNIPSFIAKSNGANTAMATIIVTPTVNSCPGISKTFDITVNPTPDVLKPTDQILCNNSNTAAVSFTGAVLGTTYNWTNSNTSIGLAANGSGDIPSFIAKSNGANIAMATITVTPTVNGCPGISKTFDITVNPMPDVLKPTDQILCNNSNTLAVVFTGVVSGTIYNWTNTNSTIGLTASSGSGNIASFIAKSNGVNTAMTTITVTPTINGCPGASKTFDITVNPISDVLQPANQAVCNGALINTISFLGSVSGTTYNWVNDNSLIGLASRGTGDISSYIAINKTSMPITANITVTPASTSCPAPSKTFSLIINPTPAVIASNNASICLGGTAQLSATGAAQYTWLPVDYLSCANCANPISKPVDSIIYTVKGTSLFGCVALDSVLLNVIKPFKMQVLPGDTLCLGESLNLNASKAKSYLWSPAGGLNRTNIANPIARPSVTTIY